MTTSTEKVSLARLEFIKRVEEIVGQSGEYLEAIAQVCLENTIDEQTAAEFVTGTLKTLVENEARVKRLLVAPRDEFVELPLG